MRYIPSRVYKAIALSTAIFSGISCSQSKQKDYPIQPLTFTEVKMTDDFWQPRMETNRTVTIRHAFEKSEETGRIENFALAGGLVKGEQQGAYPFDDSDVFKAIEGASYALMVNSDPELDAYLDSVIAIVAAAQEEDGYLYTVRTNKAERLKNWFGEQRWQKLAGSHELYNAGHLFEAAVAHYQATGKRTLLDVAVRLADLIDQSFGPDKLKAPPGHQVIEMGLAKLYRVTGEERYLRLAKFFLDVRGQPLDGRKLYGEYSQDHKPVLQQNEAVGHAVRAGYMFSGMADVAALSNDDSYVKAIDRLWENVVRKKLHLTGGIGAKGANEGFSSNYDLPNMSAYNETCASISNVYWNHRLFLLHGEAKYVDIMERTLYNALLSGISMEGTRFFYPNPLESVGQHERAEWFGCACCPANVARFIASVSGYVYAYRNEELFVNLYAANEATLPLHKGNVRVVQETNYPWDGVISLTLHPERDQMEMTLNLRIPGWAQGQPVPGDLYRYLNAEPAEIRLAVNGEPVPLELKNGFAQIRRAWQPNDSVELNLPMLVRRVVAHDSVKADTGRVALERGPIVFCAEWPDHEGGHVRNLLLTDQSELTTEFLADRLRGIQVIRGPVTGYYLDENGAQEKRAQELLAIPYYAWAHRGKGEMTVWFAREEATVSPVGLPTLASTSQVLASFGKNPEAVNDQLEPEGSDDHEVPYFHWWPNKGTTEWIQYDLAKPTEVSDVQVYWFDDTGTGECRLPESWQVLYMENGKWRPVSASSPYIIEKDQFNEVVFDTVRTTSLRLEIQSREGWAGGIHEWKVN